MESKSIPKSQHSGISVFKKVVQVGAALQQPTPPPIMHFFYLLLALLAFGFPVLGSPLPSASEPCAMHSLSEAITLMKNISRDLNLTSKGNVSNFQVDPKTQRGIFNVSNLHRSKCSPSNSTEKRQFCPERLWFNVDLLRTPSVILESKCQGSKSKRRPCHLSDDFVCENAHKLVSITKQSCEMERGRKKSITLTQQYLWISIGCAINYCKDKRC